MLKKLKPKPENIKVATNVTKIPKRCAVCNQADVEFDLFHKNCKACRQSEMTPW
jgi:hypothetical protein